MGDPTRLLLRKVHPRAAVEERVVAGVAVPVHLRSP